MLSIYETNFFLIKHDLISFLKIKIRYIMKNCTVIFLALHLKAHWKDT